MPLTLFPTLDGLHVSCFSCPGRRVTHTFIFYVPDIGKSPTRPVPKWLFFPSLAKKNIVDPSQKFFLTAGSMAAVLVFGMPSHLLFVTRKKENRGFSVSLPFALCYCGRRFFFLSAFVVSHVLWEKQTTSKSVSRGWALSNVLSIFLEYLNKLELGNWQ